MSARSQTRREAANRVGTDGTGADSLSEVPFGVGRRRSVELYPHSVQRTLVFAALAEDASRAGIRTVAFRGRSTCGSGLDPDWNGDHRPRTAHGLRPKGDYQLLSSNWKPKGVGGAELALRQLRRRAISREEATDLVCWRRRCETASKNA